METVVKKAWNPDTGREYEIELPADNVVIEALLELDYPPDGIDKWEIAEMLAEQFSLSYEQSNAKYKNGRRVFNVHLGLVSANLVKSGEMVKLGGGYRWGRKLKESASDAEVTSTGSHRIESKSNNDSIIQNPEESIDKSYSKIESKLAADLLDKVKSNTPTFFENLVIDLLVKMGYGGSREDAQAVGRSGDGGIDGVIKEDRLGFDVIYVQAKRWQSSVSEPPIRDFVGALQGRRARKGIFITTSKFSKSAQEYVLTIDSRDSKVILIDGNQLAQLMIDHNVGVSVEKTYEIKRVDSDYFAENTENS